MKGFFNTEELQSDEIQKGKVLSCISCKLYKNSEEPKVKPKGKFKKKVMIVGTSPQNNAFLGNVLTKLKFNMSRDVVVINAVNCETEEEPNSYQVQCCRRRVQNAIQEFKPKLIILLGTQAVESIIGKYWKKGLGGMTRWRGWCIPDQNYKAWVCPVFDPNYVQNQKKGHVSKLIWVNDLKKALKLVNKKVPVQPNFSDYIQFCFTNDQVHQAMKQIKNSKRFVTDIEATGLRPYRKGQKIICTGAAISPTKAFVWENTLKRDKWFAPILKSKKIKKIAHNIQFEDMWFSHLIGGVDGWEHCTMNAAHVLDNRVGISGLKFQTYVNFGVADYDDDVSMYLKGVNKKKYGANAINKIELFVNRYGMKRLLLYCGMDNIFTFMLYLHQIKEIENATND